MAKRILIVVGIPHFDYSNEKSAVCSFLQTIKTAVEAEGHLAYFPTENNEHFVTGGDQNISFKERLINSIKKVLKGFPWLYHSFSMKAHLKEHDKLIQQVKAGEKYDQIIEFYTVGSELGKQLAELWTCKLSVVYDAPVDEQFLEMRGTKTYYWTEIQKREKETLVKANKIMAYSPECKSYIIKRYEIQSDVGILPCVVSKPWVNNAPAADIFNLTFIGSFLSWHKVDLLVEVFEELRSVIPNLRLQLIGYGEEWESIKHLINKKGLEENVDMPGFVSESELLKYKKNSHIAVMPGSNWYGSPLKLFEYAQSGIPFIAPETPTIQSIFKSGEHCRYIDASNEVKSLCEEVFFLYQNPSLREEMAKRAKQLIEERYSEKRYTTKLSEILL